MHGRDLGAAAARPRLQACLAGLARQADSVADDAELSGELEPGDTRRFRLQAVDLRRRAFTLGLQARRKGMASVPRRSPRARRTLASRRVVRAAPSRRAPPGREPGADDPDEPAPPLGRHFARQRGRA
jgi:hypothetical protein